MNPFTLTDGVLHVENLPLTRIAETFGTPCYVYSRAALESSFADFQRELGDLDALVCYAVKANGNLAILNLFARLGAGFDIVSGGELQRVIAAGGDPRKIVFSGVGKTAAEMEMALRAGILCFNVESAPELERLNEVAARLGLVAPISLRVNPDVDAKTHPYISTGLKENKFGVAHDEAPAVYRHAAALPHLAVTGIDCHIGSQLLDPVPFAEALDRLLTLVDALATDGIALHHIDLGGGLGIRYNDETPPSVAAYLRPLLAKLAGRGLKVLLEPGRRLVGEAGALLTRVEYLKPGEVKNFAIVDAAMNDLARPALYDAWHDIVPVAPHSDVPAQAWDVVGPVCESGDFLGRERTLALAQGDLLALLSAGAYGMSMSSNYNSRPRAAEVIVDGTHAHLVRRRETIAELFAGETLIG
ncbi:diaminopimelate decarboxylase [Rhodocyclus tenuis]|uniref:Diaminopimelate decarboxylase n=1 Tax=Rhodocyclus gracilis TaxID=2929842 RepID=A0ABX0WGT7_9RHOO|nr:diaminopimelate decarboxylase [Rhodocyclus gracilis]NJA88506.1 diaminopimelate decarboxylase [Rhodocyclus gracilis]